MNRITNKDLEAVVKRINLITKSPETPYTRQNGKSKANIGNFHLYSAYGAVALHRMQTDGGGVNEIIGLSTKRELYEKMQAYIRGLGF